MFSIYCTKTKHVRACFFCFFVLLHVLYFSNSNRPDRLLMVFPAMMELSLDCWLFVVRSIMAISIVQTIWSSKLSSSLYPKLPHHLIWRLVLPIIVRRLVRRIVPTFNIVRRLVRRLEYEIAVLQATSGTDLCKVQLAFKQFVAYGIKYDPPGTEAA